MLRISLVLALVSIPALAAPQVSEHERALQKAKKWSDVAAQLKGRSNLVVVEEFEALVKDEEFPSSRRIKNKLEITESDGTKVTIEYKKDGAISLNGKEWKLRPLATVEDEVTRLALFINGEKKAESSLFGLVPAAQAGGAAMGGAAFAAFAGANAWKAESCGEEKLQGDLVNDCPVMGVGMQPILVTEKQEDPGNIKPTDLKCPKDNEGILELISKSANGYAQRLKVKYEDSTATKILIEKATKGKSFEKDKFIDLELGINEADSASSKKALKITDAILARVCNGTAADKKRFLVYLEKNKDEIKIANARLESTDDKSAVEAL